LERGVGFSQANRREARKLGLLCKQNFADSREHELAHTVGEKGRLGPAWRDRGATQAPIVEAAGANERVWGEKPDTDAYSNGKAGLILLDLRSTLSSKGLESDDG